jgi:AsmA protein
MKRIAKIIGALIALIIIALLVAPMFISTDALKAQLVAQVKKTTGRTLEIKGDTRVSFFPNIAVSAEDVSLSNPGGFNDPVFASFKKLQTGAQLKPLLKGELQINGITLDGAVINLEEAKDGAKNWQFTADNMQKAADTVADAPEAQKKAASPIKRFALGDITITNSTITYLKPGAKRLSVDGIDATIRGADANSPLQLEVAADYRNERVSVALTVKETKKLLNGEQSALEANITVPGGQLRYVGAAKLGDTLATQGALNVSLASLPKVLSWTTGAKASPTLPEQIGLKADAAFENQKLELTNANFAVDSLKGTGNVAVTLGQQPPAVKGRIVLGAIDLDALMPAASGSASAGNAAADSGGSSGEWSNAPINLSGLKAVDTDLALVFESLKKGKLALGAGDLKIRTNAGQLQVDVNRLQLYNGTTKGNVTASNAGIGANLALDGIDIDALMTALSGQSRLSGKTDLALNVKASGNSQRAWVNSLNGTAKLGVRDGALKGINIGQFLRNAKQGFLSESDAVATDFSDLGASFTIANGVVSNSDLAMKSPALRVSGAGTISLPPKTVNYRLVPTLAGTSKGQGGDAAVAGISVPLVISGPWAKPSITPDLAGMVQEGLNNPEALKQNLKNIKETVKDYNSIGDLKKALSGGGTAGTATTTTTTEETPATTAPLTEKEQRKKAIQDGVGSLLKGL